jgi:hypothetical protein
VNKIAAIAWNTFKEAVRNRVLYVLLFFALLILVAATVVSTLSIEQPERIVRDLGVAAINVISGLIAVFVGIGLVYNDLDKKTIYTVVSKPIKRWHFLVGKYLGLLLTIFVNVMVMTWLFAWVLEMRYAFSDGQVEKNLFVVREAGRYVSKGPGATLWYAVSSIVGGGVKGLLNVLSLGSYATANLTTGLFLSSILTMLEMAVVVAFAVLFSSFSTPTLSAFLTAITWVIGKGNQDLYLLAESILRKKGSQDVMTLGDQLVYWFAYGAAHVAPNLEVFNKREAIAYFEPVTIEPYSVAYCIGYSTMVLLVAAIVFERRNFK